MFIDNNNTLYLFVHIFSFLTLFKDTFMENYIASQRDHIFKSVQVLIYVFDVESRELERDLYYYASSVSVNFL